MSRTRVTSRFNMAAGRERTLGILNFTIFSILATKFTVTQSKTSLHLFSSAEVLDVVEESCLIAGTLPLEETLAELLSNLDDIFRDEQTVTIGTLDTADFLWPSGSKLKLKETRNIISSDQKQVIAFERRRIDRTCLLTPSGGYSPRGEYFTGPYTLHALVSYTNHICGTFRTPSGSISAAGYHRLDILDNLFHVSSVTDVHMAALYSTLNNPLNSSFIWEQDRTHGQKETENNVNCAKNDNNRKTNLKQPIKMAECERLKVPPTKEEFFNLYLKRSRPVILEDIVSHWPAYAKWRTEYLLDKFSDKAQHIKLTPGGDFEGVESAELWENYKVFKIPTEVRDKLPYPDLVVVRPAYLNMKFSQFIDLINKTSGHGPNISAYLEYSSVSESFPGAEEDVLEPEFTAKLLKRKHLNVWLSDGNTLGRLHFDPFDNLLCQMSGKKQVILFDPHDNTRLYEAHIPEAILGYNSKTHTFRRRTLTDSTSMVMSPVDILNPDLKRFPHFSKAHPLNCTLGEGDMLFMPAFWWHEVQSYPSMSQHRNLAVNFWYEPFLTKEFPCPECKLDVNPLYHHLLY